MHGPTSSDYLTARNLRLLINRFYTVPRMGETFSVSVPSVCNSLSYHCRSAECFSGLRRALKTKLFDSADSERKQSAY